MNEITLDQNDEELLTYEVSDEVLEVAAGTEKANTFTQWVCTAVYLCPGFCPRFIPSCWAGRGRA